MSFSPAKCGSAGREDFEVRCSTRAVGIRNPIREIMDTIAGKENPSKRVISLAQGDPSAYPHLRPPEVMVHGLLDAVNSFKANGYQPSQGNSAARAAIAEFFKLEGRPALTSADVFMTIGCSEALNHSIAALAVAGSNILLPRPGFPLYEVLCDYHGVEVRHYDLLPNSNWEIDLESVAKSVDKNTVAFLINTPSNPCGNVFSKAHLTDVMAFAERMKLTIIADEVYHGMSFEQEFTPCAAVNPKVPVLSVCALSKVWLAPGWRVGWINVYDNEQGDFKKAGVGETLLKLCQVSLGPAAPMQASIPTILQQTPAEWYKTVQHALKLSAECCVRRCREVPGLEVAAEPEGSMYLMVRIVPGALRELDDDVKFAGTLLQEESVVVLPGKCFGYPGYFRVVFAAPVAALDEGWDRIEGFCSRNFIGKR